MSKKFTFIDLFAGCGGLSEGFMSSGHFEGLAPVEWELPGGKIESNESEIDCIQREIKEELDIDIQVGNRCNPVMHAYPDFSIELIPYTANHVGGEIKLKEHAQYLLLDKSELQELDWAEADVPIVEELISKRKVLSTRILL